MTDKEKLDAIRAEVQNYIYAAHKAHTNITEGNFAHLLSFIDSLQEEPVSEDLGEYLYELSKQFPEVSFAKLSRIGVRVAKWKEGQLKKNRLEHFDALTKEEAQREYDFVMGIIKNEHRIPTFDDAIKYGMMLQKESEGKVGEISEVK